MCQINGFAEMWNESETIGDFTGEDALESKKVKAFSSPLRTGLSVLDYVEKYSIR